MTETTDNFIPHLRLVIYVNILLGICIGVRGVVVPTVANPKDVGPRPSNCSFFFFFFFVLFFIIIITVRFQH